MYIDSYELCIVYCSVDYQLLSIFELLNVFFKRNKLYTMPI